MNKLTLAFSPCPNDTYIFDALVNQKISTEGLTFEYHLADVQQLNEAAYKETYDITKVSLFSFLTLTNNYCLLNSGAALGFGTGPLLIADKPYSLQELKGKKIAIPGIHTTANMLFSLAMPYETEKISMPFSDIENAVLKNEVQAGVIIHENRFTYQAKGLIKIMDLGNFWEKETGMPVPLGGIAAHKRLPLETMKKVSNLIYKSIEYANANAGLLPEFVTCNAQEMSEEVMHKHIDLYVNEYSLKWGSLGKKAVETMFSEAFKAKLIDHIPASIFLPDIN